MSVLILSSGQTFYPSVSFGFDMPTVEDLPENTKIFVNEGIRCESGFLLSVKRDKDNRPTYIALKALAADYCNQFTSDTAFSLSSRTMNAILEHLKLETAKEFENLLWRVQLTILLQNTSQRIIHLHIHTPKGKRYAKIKEGIVVVPPGDSKSEKKLGQHDDNV